MAHEFVFTNGLLTSAIPTSGCGSGIEYTFEKGLLVKAVNTGASRINNYTFTFQNGILTGAVLTGSFTGGGSTPPPPTSNLQFIAYEGYYNPVTPVPIYGGHYDDGPFGMDDYTDPGVHRIGNYIFEKFIFKLTFPSSYPSGRIVYDLEFFDYAPGDVRYYSSTEFAGMQTYLYPDRYDTLYTHFGETLYGTTSGLSISLISINKTRKLINSTSSDWSTGPGTRWMSIAFESLYRTVPVSFQLHAVYWLSGGTYTQLWP